MRPAFLMLLATTAFVSAVQPVLAADPAAVAAQPADVSPAPKSIDKKIERIRIEDAGTRINELRVGGETKTITVQPKGGMPAYDVKPDSGERSWKILGF